MEQCGGTSVALVLALYRSTIVLVRSPRPGARDAGVSSCAGTGSMLQKLSMSFPNVVLSLSSWLYPAPLPTSILKRSPASRACRRNSVMSGLYPQWEMTSAPARLSLVTNEDRSGALDE